MAAKPGRIGPRRNRRGGRRGRSPPIEDAARGVVAVDGAKAAARLVQVPVDGVLGEAQFPGDLLRAHVPIDEAQAFALTLGEAIQALGLSRQGVIALIHDRNLMRTPRIGKRPEH